MYGKKLGGSAEGEFQKQSVKGTGEIPADLLLVDFDNVYVADMLQIADTNSLLVYGSMKDSPNITQIQFDMGPAKQG